MSRTFCNNKILEGDSVAIVTNAGGPSVLSTDTIEKYGLKLAQLNQKTREKLDEYLPRMASFINPIDVLGDSLAVRFGVALEIVLQEENVDAVVAILTPQLMTEIEKTAEVISKLSAKYSQPIFCSFIGGSKVTSGENILNKKNIANFDYPERAIYCLAKMWEWKKKITPDPSLTKEGGEIFLDINLSENIKKIITEAKGNKQKILDNFQSSKLMEVLELSVPVTEKINNSNDGIKFAKKNGWPVVLKISGGEVFHKSEINGVITNIRSEYQLKKAFEKLKELKHDIQIQQQIEGGVEVIVGIKRDPNFGCVLLFGAGGKMAELIKDRNLRLFPLTDDKVERMINESKVYTLLNGFRNDKKYDLVEFKKVIFAIEKLMVENSDIEEMEINPVIITHGQAFCVDVKVKLY
jgi:acetyltransferase